MKLVSILLRSMDRDSIIQSLASVAAQTYPNLEIVVVNASGHPHQALEDYYGNARLRLIDSAKPLDRSTAANAALDAANGDYLLFLDDDDLIEHDHVTNLVEALKDSEALAAYSKSLLIYPNGDSKIFSFDQDISFWDLAIGNRFTIHSVLFNRKALDLGCRFDPGLKVYEDWDFWLQLRRISAFVSVPSIGAIYQIRDSSGVWGDSSFIAQARSTLLEKWQKAWNQAELEALVKQLQQLEQAQAILAFPDDLPAALEQREREIQKLHNQLTQLTELHQHQLTQLTELHQLAEQEKEFLEHERNLLAEEIVRIKKTLSWRITAPIRKARSLAKTINLYRNHFSDLWRNQGGLENSIRKIIQTYQKEGIQGLKVRMLGLPNQDYVQWIQLYDTLNPGKIDRIRNRIEAIRMKPTISIVMPVYKPDIQWLTAAIDSVKQQIYPNWELCIADDFSNDPKVRDFLNHSSLSDSRIHVTFRDTNGHISAATNSALKDASGDYVAFMDQDDVLSADALFWVVALLNEKPSLRLIYSDEDKINERNERYDHYFKPDWNYDLLLSQNYLCHLSIYEKSLLDELGGLRLGLEGAQDHDLALRAIDCIKSEEIGHIPRILYHWRSHSKSTALHTLTKPYAIKAGLKAIEDHLSRNDVHAHVTPMKEGHYRVRYEVPNPPPSVSIVIPSRNQKNLLETCIRSLLERTTYSNFSICVIDNNSDEPDSIEYLDSIDKNPRITVLKDPRPFNFSALNNHAIEQIDADFIVLMNNDIEVITPDWLDEMLGIGCQPGVGAVGARLWYPNNTLQHGGVILVGGVAGHAHKYLPRDNPGYAKRAIMQQSFSAVTAAVMLIRKSIYVSVDGLNETKLAVAFNDVDFCLRLNEAGYRNVWTPYAEFYHYESASRGSDLTGEKQKRFAEEVGYMESRWGDLLKNDPAYNPNLHAGREDFSLAYPPRVDLLMR